MSILLPCLFCAALGLLFGGIHLLHSRMIPGNHADNGAPSECGGMCASCSFGCGMAQGRRSSEEGNRDA